MSDSPTLAPCPFCGVVPTLKPIDGIVGISCGPDSDCDKTGLCVLFPVSKQATAIAAWNRRTPRGTPEQIAVERQFTIEAINGAMLKGSMNQDAPAADHWLAPFWKLGAALREHTTALPAIPDGQGSLLDPDDDEFHDSRLTGRLSHLLTGVADAIKGKPGPLELHGWHDLPELVAKQTGALRKFVNFVGILGDGPDDSDKAHACRLFMEAYSEAKQLEREVNA